MHLVLECELVWMRKCWRRCAVLLRSRQQAISHSRNLTQGRTNIYHTCHIVCSPCRLSSPHSERHSNISSALCASYHSYFEYPAFPTCFSMPTNIALIHKSDTKHNAFAVTPCVSAACSAPEQCYATSTSTPIFRLSQHAQQPSI